MKRRIYCTTAMLLCSLMICTMISCAPRITVDSFTLRQDTRILDVGDTAILQTVFHLSIGNNAVLVTFAGDEIELEGEQYSEKDADRACKAIEQYTIEYRSDNEEAVRIDDKGRMQAGATGKATITVIVQPLDQKAIGLFEQTASVDIEVIQTVSYLDVDKEITLTVGETYDLKPIIFPENASDTSLLFESDNTRVAQVNDKGQISAIDVGTALINVIAMDRFADNKVSAEILVTVERKTEQYKTPQQPPSQQPLVDHAELQQELLRLVNEARSQNGLAELTWSASIAASAGIRSIEIISVWGHKRPDGSDCFTVNPDVRGENIAAGYYTAQGVFEGWMNSPGHRENILRASFKTMGSACTELQGTTYIYYWVQLFG